MRVCLVGQYHPLAMMGGAEYQTHLLAAELSTRAGVSVHYLARGVPPQSAAGSLGYTVHRIGSEAGIRRRAVFFDAPLLAQTLRTLRPDVIYQRMKQSYTAVCSWHARRSDVPFFFHVASDGDLGFDWLRTGRPANLPFDVAEALAGNWGMRRASHVIVQSLIQQRMLRARTGLEATAVVRNFQPLPRALVGKPPGRMRVLWVGNIKEVKRPEVFVELARSFLDRDEFEFHMVGRPWNHRRYVPLMTRIRETRNLTFHGELPLDEVNQLMEQASFFVNTSRFEGFPNTFVQAWARGCIVVSLAVDPCEGMEKLRIGFRAGTLEGMRAVIDQLSRDRRRCVEIAGRSFEWVHAHHSLSEAARLADLMLGEARRRQMQSTATALAR